MEDSVVRTTFLNKLHFPNGRVSETALASLSMPIRDWSGSLRLAPSGGGAASRGTFGDVGVYEDSQYGE
jgi:hypothetical protein